MLTQQDTHQEIVCFPNFVPLSVRQVLIKLYGIDLYSVKLIINRYLLTPKDLNASEGTLHKIKVDNEINYM